MNSKSNLEHLVSLMLVAVVTSVLIKIFAFGPLGLAILAGCAIAAYAML